MIRNQGGQGEISEEKTKDSRFSQPLSKGEKRDFPGSPVIKTLPSKAGMPVRPLIGELRSHILLAWPKKKRKKKYPQVLYCFPRQCKKVKGRELQVTAGTTEKRLLQLPWESCRRRAAGSLARAGSAPGGEITEAGSLLLDWGIPRRASAAAEPVQAWPRRQEWGRGDHLSRP